jgi:H(+)-translocating pyrophosphatase
LSLEPCDEQPWGREGASAILNVAASFAAAKFLKPARRSLYLSLMALRPSAAAVYRNAHMEEEGNSCFSSFDGLRMSVSSDMRQDEKFARALLHPYLKPAAIALALLGGLILWLGIDLGGGILAFAWMTSIFSLLLAANLVSRIFQEDVSACGAMLAIASAIRQGANGFLLTQYAAIARFFTLLSLVLFLVYFLRPPSSIADTTPLSRAFITALSFLIGGGCSAFAGWVGVWISVRCNIRVAAAAARQSSGDALKIAFNGGAVASLISAALCIVGICLLYSGCYLVFVSSWSYSPTVLPMLLTGYGFGASFVALFMQLGGGIYTKAADVGADLIGKIEAGIPEDDPRNPAVIADLVGDNVGDCAGSMADVFESIAAEVIGTMILGAELAHGMPNGAENSHCFILFPLIVHSMDMIVSSVGIWLVSRASESQCSEPLAVMRRAYAVTAILSIFGLFLTTRFVLYVPTAPHAWFWFFCCGIVGVITAFLLVLITQYYTDYAYAPVQSIAAASVSGHATNIIAGVSVGFISTAAPSVVICSAVLSSYHFGARSGVLPAATAGEFGVAVRGAPRWHTLS